MTFVQPQTAEPLGPESVVQVTNLDDKPLTLDYDSRTYRWNSHGEKGDTQWVPFPIVALHFGDPRAIANPAAYRDRHHAPNFIASREQEVSRLRQQYGGTFHGDQHTFTGIPFNEYTKEFGDPYDLPIPHVEVHDSEGNRVYTVLEDPMGEKAQPLVPATGISTEEQLAAMQRQIEATQAQMERLMAARNEEPPTNAIIPPPEDTGSRGTHTAYTEPTPRGGVAVDVEPPDSLPSDD